MSAHTPGPWSVGEDMQGTRRVFAERNEIVRALSKHGSRRLSKAERTANARLIAAAPDMLAALREWVNWQDAGCPGDGLEILETARAAIAKAEGN